MSDYKRNFIFLKVCNQRPTSSGCLSANARISVLRFVINLVANRVSQRRNIWFYFKGFHKKITVNRRVHYLSTYLKHNFTFWVLNWQLNLLETCSMNNEIRHVTWGFGNVWITFSTFSSIGLQETHPQTSNVF